ncbi:hypothetical protein FHR70_000481 [Microvirga lupini]|uniref:Uncharacterized protein n=1 Tax=Microvirga lupini TaxID=420324 RepID=A0A7W4VHS3_9HYPH|nr:hypothetical protein [Microvirga lupini]MBB3017441.1 hypothetical protein [Microvirga lupini]
MLTWFVGFLKRFGASLIKTARGDWSQLSIFDKCSMGITCVSTCLGLYAISPELEVLQQIRDRLAPPIRKEDVVYVRRAARDGEAVAIELQKTRTDEPVSYEVWMCSGEGGRELIFFGSGRFGREENSVTLRNVLSENPSQVLLKVADADRVYARHEEWDLYRSVKETDTKILHGDVQCGEI